MKKEKTIDTEKGKTEEVACIQCARATTHEILSSVLLTFSSREMSAWETYEILECCGCHEISFQKSEWSDGDYSQDEDGEWTSDKSIEIFPSRTIKRKRLDGYKSGFGPIPKSIHTIYEETYVALCNKQITLCAAGLRILLERICVENKTEGKDLKEKINDLLEKGYCSKKDASLLQGTRLFGNGAVHKAQSDVVDLEAAFDVLEHVLNSIYILPFKAKSLSRLEENHTKNFKVD